MTHDEEVFINAFLDFSEIVRSNIGFDEKKFEYVCKCLTALEHKFRSDQAVSLEVANIFIDLWGAIDSSSSRYDDETAQKIRYAADTLSHIARSVTSTD